MITPLYEIRCWRLGQLFFRKYPTFLSNDGNNSKFLYYSLNKEKKDDGGNSDGSDGSDGGKGTDGHSGTDGNNNDSNGKNTALIVSLSIVIPVIVIAVVVIIIIFLRKRNKKVEELLSDKNETENEKKYALMDNTN